jgi:AraC-like DNA-binding protein
MVAAGIVDVACAVGERYGITRAELLYVGALEPSDLRDPAARVPSDALLDITRYLLERSGDRSFGIRFAEAMDLRTQGFWGYLFLSCLTLRKAAELMQRFQGLRHSTRLTLVVEDDWAVFTRTPEPGIPPELEAVVGDAFLASFCFHRRRWLPVAHGAMHAWLSYPEEPHHSELRALVGGPITFAAPCNRHMIPACELDLPMRGSDPHLHRLAHTELERQLTQLVNDGGAQDLGERVRRVLSARLEEGASLERVARQLHLSARTLRRRLDALGLTFQRLLEEVRRDHAVEYLTKTEDAIDRVAERLGYGDPSNFRRAFRRWTGQPPAAFRAAHGARAQPKAHPKRSSSTP